MVLPSVYDFCNYGTRFSLTDCYSNSCFLLCRKEKKDKDIKHKQRDTINSAKDKEREEKREQRQREREAEERYEEWLIKKVKNCFI